MTDTPITHAGFAAIIGAPNAGKSTLTNRLVGTKVAIVTHKVQTTRFPVRGVAQVDGTQIVLVDTPGIFAAKRRLDRAMVKAAWSGADDADAIVHLIDASAWVAEREGKVDGAQKKSLEDDRRVIEQLQQIGRKAFLALNKIDLFPHDQVLPIIAELNETGVYEEVFMISAENGEGVEALEKALAKLMLRLHQELPYQLMVETESWEEKRDGSVRVQQVVVVGRDNHKSMVLGKGGAAIKDVGRKAREELSEMLGRKVHLFLFVKVDERWQERRESYQGLGLEFDV